ncbi:hypothetical protein CEXT_208571 [Caerostris extrusa]|uniref:Uncharacterized protein n=1 Tax=Caerostris extrusa TaxID=172846 RepID=A0AAV4XIL6_CAEEX|nr:hypothetical protein CEXT_208571 [Caerostris extrusa]
MSPRKAVATTHLRTGSCGTPKAGRNTFRIITSLGTIIVCSKVKRTLLFAHRTLIREKTRRGGVQKNARAVRVLRSSYYLPPPPPHPLVDKLSSERRRQLRQERRSARSLILGHYSHVPRTLCCWYQLLLYTDIILISNCAILMKQRKKWNK